MKNKKDYIHKEYPKLCDPKDFYGQVKRTVNGKPISEDQINLIVQTIIEHLDLNELDYLFDIGCGNGALASRVFDSIKGYIGVDFSEYLVKIGKENFEKQGFEIVLDDALDFLKKTEVNEKITKVLCYGVFSYFNPYDTKLLIELLSLKFPNVTRIFIGNIPDKERASNFYYKEIDYTSLLDDYESSIGKWWSKNEINELLKNTKWNANFFNMPESFYSAHYRFDLLLNLD